MSTNGNDWLQCKSLALYWRERAAVFREQMEDAERTAEYYEHEAKRPSSIVIGESFGTSNGYRVRGDGRIEGKD